MKSAKLLFGALSIGAAAMLAQPAQAITVLSDNFNDNVIDRSLWSVRLGAGQSYTGSSVTEQNQRMEIVQRGHLATQQQFDQGAVGPLTITGRWTFSSDDFFQALTRSNGLPAGQFGETGSGVQFFFHANGAQQLDVGPLGAGFAIANEVKVGSLNITAGQVFDFSITDDGANVSFSLTQVGNPGNTASVTAQVTGQGINQDRIVFHNREGGGRTGFLDDVVIQANSAPAAAAVAPFLNIGPAGGDGFFGVREVRGNGTINSLATAIASLQSGNGTITNGTASRINFFDAGGGGSTGEVGGDSAFIGDVAGNDEDFALIANGNIKVVNGGTYTFYARGDDGAQLRIGNAFYKGVSENGDGDAFVIDNLAFNGSLGGNVRFFATVDLAPGIYPVEYLFFERSGGAYAELWSAFGSFTSFNTTDFRLVGDSANGGLQLVFVPEPTTAGLMGIVGLAMFGTRRRRNV